MFMAEEGIELETPTSQASTLSLGLHVLPMGLCLLTPAEVLAPSLLLFLSVCLQMLWAVGIVFIHVGLHIKTNLHYVLG